MYRGDLSRQRCLLYQPWAVAVTMSEERRQTPSREPTRVVLEGACLARIRDHLQASYPEEACGALLGHVTGDRVEVLRAISTANALDAERSRRYLIGPDDVLELERHAENDGLQVVGYYHSHPDAPPEPSDFDRDHAWPWYAHLIASVDDGQLTRIRAWRLADDRRRFEPLQLLKQTLAPTREAPRP